MSTRMEVMGASRVTSSLVEASGFARPLQEIVTGFAWGDIWNRPGIDRKQRSIMTLGMLIALGKPAELRAHVRGAVNNGLTVDEIRELVIHSAVYCGFPAALEASRACEESFAEIAAG